MKVTIGEIINELYPYSTRISTYTVQSLPYVTAPIRSGGNITRIWLSVLQTSEHKYAVATTEDIHNGNDIIPTADMNRPFVREKNYLSMEVLPDDLIVERIDRSQFKGWLYKQLYDYDIIRFNPVNWYVKMSDMGFNSSKIRRAIDQEFNNHHLRGGTILDLITIVGDRGSAFKLPALANKELSCVNAKLRNLGLVPTFNGTNIIRMEYDKRSRYSDE